MSWNRLPGLGLGRVVFAAALLLGSLGFGGPGDFDRGKDFLERQIEELGLDAQTAEAVRAAAQESHEKTQALREELRDARREMHELLGQDEPDEAVVMGQAQRMGDLETELRKARLASMLRIRSLLTPEQRERMMAHHRGMYRERKLAVLDACQQDMQTFCGEEEAGPRCLHGHRDELSQACRDALHEAHRGHGRHHGPRECYPDGPPDGPPGPPTS